jgi:hypothetical protein
MIAAAVFLTNGSTTAFWCAMAIFLDVSDLTYIWFGSSYVGVSMFYTTKTYAGRDTLPAEMDCTRPDCTPPKSKTLYSTYATFACQLILHAAQAIKRAEQRQASECLASGRLSSYQGTLLGQ